MKKRFKLNKSRSRGNFKSGTRTHKKNLNTQMPMRGGIRL